MAAAYRLLYMPLEDEAHARRYIYNSDSMPLRAAPSLQLLPRMYVIVHQRTILFYTGGEYYGFGLGDDGVEVRLVGAGSPGLGALFGEGSVEYFMQDSKGPKIEDSQQSLKVSHVANWESLLRTARSKSFEKAPDAAERRGEGAGGPKEKRFSDMARARAPAGKRGFASAAPDGGSAGRLDTNTHAGGVREQARPQKVSEEAADNPAVQSLVSKLQILLSSLEGASAARPRDKAPPKHPAPTAGRAYDIESDSDLVAKTRLAVTIEKVLSGPAKSFTLETENGLCVTRYKGVFIMTKCSGASGQVFSLDDAGAVAERLRHGEAALNKHGTKRRHETESAEDYTESAGGYVESYESEGSDDGREEANPLRSLENRPGRNAKKGGTKRGSRNRGPNHRRIQDTEQENMDPGLVRQRQINSIRGENRGGTGSLRPWNGGMPQLQSKRGGYPPVKRAMAPPPGEKRPARDAGVPDSTGILDKLEKALDSDRF